MRQQRFEQLRTDQWRELRQLLDQLERMRWRRDADPEGERRLPRLYRNLCNDYALARHRHYSPTLVRELHDLISRGHRQLYRTRGGWSWHLVRFLLAEFPRTLRQQAVYFWLALAVFVVPGLILGLLCHQDPELIFSLLDADQVASIEQMYDPANRNPGRPAHRGSETNLAMFGFYIHNNIGIGFRTFAGGILLGIGTLFYLFHNSVVLGSISGHLTQLGYSDTFWTFVAGHGAFELTAIVICGAAGLMLGHAVLAPGRYPRVEALRIKAKLALRLVMGAAAMLLVAAFIEAFWSSLHLQPMVKYGAAMLLWSLVIAHLILGGRD